MKKIIVLANGRKKVQTINEEPSMTQQQFKDQVDVNNIMKKYKKTGTITHLRNAELGVYADLSEIPLDLLEAKSIIQQAESAFMDVPSEIRVQFDNDPVKFVEFLKNPQNDEQAIKYGLKKPKPSPDMESITPPIDDKK